MVRTVISLPEDDKAWLDARAKREGKPMTALVREAVALLRAKKKPSEMSWEEALEATRGTWTEGDGLEWQLKLRAEWDRDDR